MCMRMKIKQVHVSDGKRPAKWKLFCKSHSEVG